MTYTRMIAFVLFSVVFITPSYTEAGQGYLSGMACTDDTELSQVIEEMYWMTPGEYDTATKNNNKRGAKKRAEVFGIRRSCAMYVNVHVIHHQSKGEEFTIHGDVWRIVEYTVFARIPNTFISTVQVIYGMTNVELLRKIEKQIADEKKKAKEPKPTQHHGDI